MVSPASLVPTFWIRLRLAARQCMARSGELFVLLAACGFLLTALRFAHAGVIGFLRDRFLVQLESGVGFFTAASSPVLSRIPMDVFSAAGGGSLARAVALQIDLLLLPFRFVFASAAVLLLSVCAASCFLILSDEASTQRDLSRAFRVFFWPLLSCAALALVVTFAWVPLVTVFLGRLAFSTFGIILFPFEVAGAFAAFALVPRFAAAPLLVLEGEGTVSAIRTSHARSAQLRWPLFVQSAGFFVLGSAVLMAQFIVGTFVTGSLWIFLSSLADTACLAMTVAFGVSIGRDILTLPSLTMAEERGVIREGTFAQRTPPQAPEPAVPQLAPSPILHVAAQAAATAAATIAANVSGVSDAPPTSAPSTSA